jgi:cytochrome c oxidase assembly protein subunit 15
LTRRKPEKSRTPSALPLSPWPHRLAWVLSGATFVLLYAGGTVTTYSAGMAVPDWPTTEGFWLYPVGKWLGGEWDVFLEHGHRLLALAVGLMTIALAVALWRLDARKWMRWLGVAAVGGVILQATLGGLRVLGDELLLAKVHACTGPLFFSLCAAIVTLTSRRWEQSAAAKRGGPARLLPGLALALCLALYLQIVLGAQLRHMSPLDPPGWFNVWVWLKLIVAGLIAIGVVWLWVYVFRGARDRVMVVRWSGLLAAIFFLQLLLGAATWVLNYGWPLWFKDYVWQLDYTVVAEGGLQVVTTTVHAAVGSLNLVAALSLVLWSRRRLPGAAR